MNFDISFLATTTITIFFVTLVIVFFKGNKKTKVEKISPPNAKGAWPIIGHLHLLGGSKPPHLVFGDMAENHGPIFTVKLGIHRALVVSDQKIVKECFTTHDKAFANRPKSVAVELMGYNYAMFGLAPYGEYWRQVRKIVMHEVLSQRRVEMLGHIRVLELRESMNESLYEVWVKNKNKNKYESLDMVKVDMKQWFGSFVLNNLVRIISGKRFSPNDEEGIRFQKAVRKFFELLGAFVVSDFIPYVRGFDIGGYEKEMMKVAKEMDEFIEGWLEEHKRLKQSNQDETNAQAFMGVLISVLEVASEEDFPGFDHDTIIKAACLTILIAGLDTTSATLTWALSLLMNNPKALKAAQDEIDEHVGRERLVEESDLKNLVYLEAVIKETLRLYPAGPLSVPHESMEDCMLSGYHIPKGTCLLTNLWKMQRDPNIWSDPNEFQPERFLTNHKDIDVKGNHFELLPFGSGRRMCPGIFFALGTLRLTLASLLQQFVLVKPTDEPIDMSESWGLTTDKALPLEILISPRLSRDMYPIGV